MAVSGIKALLRELLRKRGYEIRKAPADAYVAAPIFDLAVQLMMAKSGERVRFIQVGANDGVYGDPLRKYVLRYPWTGVLIEPQPDVFEALQRNYVAVTERLKFENVAITAACKAMKMYRAPQAFSGGTVYSKSVASVDRGVTASQLKLVPGELEELEVPCMTLDDVVARHRLLALELLQIDTEGHEWIVLQTLDLGKTRPTLIQFEHGHMSPAHINAAVQRLSRHGYTIHFGGRQTDTVAIHSDFIAACGQ